MSKLCPNKKRKRKHRGGLRKREKQLVPTKFFLKQTYPSKDSSDPTKKAPPKVRQRLLIQIQRSIRARNFKRFLRLTARHDHPAFNQTKVWAMIQQENYKEALQFIRNEIQAHPKYPRVYLYHKAYCQYRLHQYKKALASLRKFNRCRASKTYKQGILCLRAQVYYRLNEFDKCLKIMQRVKPGGNITREELNSNQLAIRASKSFQAYFSTPATPVPPPLETVETFEALFNLGSLYLSQGQLDRAIETLNRAARIGGYTESVCMQLGYAHQLLGEDVRARSYYRRGKSLLAKLNLATVPSAEQGRRRAKITQMRLRRRLLAVCKNLDWPLWQRKHIYTSVFLSLMGNKKKRSTLCTMIRKHPFRGTPSGARFGRGLRRLSHPRGPPPRATAPLAVLTYAAYLQSLAQRRARLRAALRAPPAWAASLPGLLSARAGRLGDRALAARTLLATRDPDATVTAAAHLARGDLKAALTHLADVPTRRAQAHYFSLLALVEPEHAARTCTLRIAPDAVPRRKKTDEEKAAGATPTAKVTGPRTATVRKPKRKKRKRRLPKPLPNGQLPAPQPHRWLSKHAKMSQGLLVPKKKAGAAGGKRVGSGKKRGGGAHSGRGRRKRGR